MPAYEDFPAEAEISAVPSPSNAVARGGFGKFIRAARALFGTTGKPDAALAAMKLLDPQLVLNLKPIPTVAANALTITVKGRDDADLAATNPGFVSQRSAALGDAGFSLRLLEANVALVVPAGATLGHPAGQAGLIFVYLLDNTGGGGGQEVAVTSRYQGLTGRFSTTAISDAADSADVMYSANARNDLPGRLITVFQSTQAAAGTWAAAPTAGRRAPHGPELAPPRGHIQGFVCANNGADANNDIDIPIGELTSDSGWFRCFTTGTIVKRLDAAWAVGSGNGGLDNGAKAADTWYYIHLIRKDDSGAIDALFSTSATAPVMPAGWSRMRCIFAVLTDSGSNIVGFKATEISGGGVLVKWNSPTMDIDLANTLGVAARTDPVKVPNLIKVNAHLHVRITDGGFAVAYLSDPDQPDVAPSTNAAPLSTIGMPQNADFSAYEQVEVMTSATGTIRARATATLNVYQVVTLGFEWSRR